MNKEQAEQPAKIAVIGDSEEETGLWGKLLQAAIERLQEQEGIEITLEFLDASQLDLEE